MPDDIDADVRLSAAEHDLVVLEQRLNNHINPGSSAMNIAVVPRTQAIPGDNLYIVSAEAKRVAAFYAREDAENYVHLLTRPPLECPRCHTIYTCGPCIEREE